MTNHEHVKALPNANYCAICGERIDVRSVFIDGEDKLVIFNWKELEKDARERYAKIILEDKE